MFDKLLDFVVNAVKYENKVQNEKAEELRREDLTIPRDKEAFWATRKAGDLIGVCKDKARRHRERERYYTKKLAESEKELMEKGISMEVYDASTGTYVTQNYSNSPQGREAFASIASGAISLTGMTGVGNAQSQQFQPRVDQKMLDRVKNNKNKMLEHRAKAEQFEKYAKAFTVNPDFTLRLSMDDVAHFGLADDVIEPLPPEPEPEPPAEEDK